MSVVIETTLGDITVDLFVEERKVACLNFLKLCKLKYYNFNLFHTVEQGFIAQTGDPSGVGNGGSSVWGVVEGVHKRFFQVEKIPKIHHTTPGLLSLVSAGDELVGSQFFFTLGENLRSLDGKHCVIGEIVEGFEILRKINEAIVDEKFRPYQDIRITHTVVLDDPFPDPRGFQVPSRSPSPTADRLKNGRIAADEDVDDTEGKTSAEIEDMLAEREAKARATILEIVGDLPDATMAPPENVLFVCKLNPVTLEDDLEIIFSRFGKVKSCEVIRDKKSGDSLQYAFVEFEDQKCCEAAYLKMDNVLIDDRRIHVDFSQSVAKVKWRGKGRGVEGPSGRIDFNNLREGHGHMGERKDKQRNGMGRGGGRTGARDGHRQPPEQSRQTSAERRKAREERHREQDRERERDREYRHRQRSRSTDRRRQDRGERYEDRNQTMHKFSRNDFQRERNRDDRRDNRNRSRSREIMQRNDRRTSPLRQPRDKRSRERQLEKPKRQRAASSSSEREKTKVRKHKSNNKKNVKRKRRASTSDEDSSSSTTEDETESSSSTESDSSEDSSSDDTRRKKKQKKQKSKKSKRKIKKNRKNKSHR